MPPVGSDFHRENDWAYDDRPAVSKAAMHEAFSGTPTRFRDDGVPGGVPGAFDPSSVGGNNDEVAARARRAYRASPPGWTRSSPAGTAAAEPRTATADPGSVPGTSRGLRGPARTGAHLLVADAEASPVVEAFGEYAAACLYSKNWMHREAALHKMEGDIARGAVKTDNEVFRAVCQSLGRLFKDKVANVFSVRAGCSPPRRAPWARALARAKCTATPRTSCRSSWRSSATRTPRCATPRATPDGAGRAPSSPSWRARWFGPCDRRARGGSCSGG